MYLLQKLDLVAQYGMMVAPTGLPAAAVSSPSLAHTTVLNGTTAPAEYSQIMLGQLEIAQYGMMVTPAAAVSSPSLAHTALLNGTTVPAEYYSDLTIRCCSLSTDPICSELDRVIITEKRNNDLILSVEVRIQKIYQNKLSKIGCFAMIVLSLF